MPQDKEDRDYKKEYDNYHSKPEQIANRSKRNKARRKMEKKGRVSKGDGKEVDHNVPLIKGGSNDVSNLSVKSRSANRKKGASGSSGKSSSSKSRGKGPTRPHTRGPIRSKGGMKQGSGKRTKRAKGKKFSTPRDKTNKNLEPQQGSGRVSGPKSEQKKVDI